jgi:thymidylate synthase
LYYTFRMSQKPNLVDEEYFRLLKTILIEGRLKKNRTGINTLGVFGKQAKFDVDLDAFPILTTKKVWFKGIVHELLWFIKGDTNIKYLVDNDVHIWDDWAFVPYKKTPLNQLKESEKQWDLINSQGYIHKSQDDFIATIKTDPDFAKTWGELGVGTYGGMWRAFPAGVTELQPVQYQTMDGHPDGSWSVPVPVVVDQLQKVITKLIQNPDDRRMIVSAWHPYFVDHCALPPCHCLFHFNTEELTIEERLLLAPSSVKDRAAHVAVDAYDKEGTYSDELTKAGIPTRRLNVLLYQRSCDFCLGIPYNVTSYSLLLAMVAHCVNMHPGTFTHTYGDLHIYENHMEGIKLQLTRESMPLPKLWLNPEVKDLFAFKYDDIKLIDYKSHPKIEFQVAV